MPRPETGGHPITQEISWQRFNITSPYHFPPEELQEGLAPGPLRAEMYDPVRGLRIVESVAVEFKEIEDYENLKEAEEAQFVLRAILKHYTENRKGFLDLSWPEAVIDKNGMMFMRGPHDKFTNQYSLRGYIARPEALGEREIAALAQLPEAELAAHAAAERTPYIVPPAELFKRAA